MGCSKLANQCRRALLQQYAVDIISLVGLRNGVRLQRVSERSVVAGSCRGRLQFTPGFPYLSV